ncbi:MAG TPA: squalene synthase HpnC [Candidatus Kapabacteria bacterium]|nr:squalene synthase HpnC [Candidatus Kapabacteria bacterium]
MSNSQQELAFNKASNDLHRLAHAYAECRKIALGHYENFPVGSVLLPKNVRPDFFALYAFMRQADDLADLPHRSTKDKLEALANWRDELHRSFDADVLDQELLPTFLALRYTTRKHGLSQVPFERLLDAFEFDARGEVHFDRFEDLLWYCDRSANPVGELVLALFGYHDPERIALSNNICSGLQLLNFCQDIKEDLDYGRTYFATKDLARLGISDPTQLKQSTAARKAVLMQMAHVRRMLRTGAPLTEMVEGRLRYELRAVIFGALAMLSKLEQVQGDSLTDRPKLSKLEHLGILLKSLLRRPRP